MRIRPMQLSGLPTVATISSKAFRTTEFFRYICPGLDDYPDDFRAFFLRCTRNGFSKSERSPMSQRQTSQTLKACARLSALLYGKELGPISSVTVLQTGNG